MKIHSAGNVIARSNFRHAKIMVIEDNTDHRFIISKALEHCLPEVKPVFVSTKDEAVAHLDKTQREEWELPKLIMLDLYMPDRQDGWQLLDYIRSMPTTLGKVPVVMLSYSNERADIVEAYKRGCSSYSVKPSAFEDWIDYFQTLRSYWWETVTLPRPGVLLF